MDYRLKSLYEQMLRGETVKQASGEQPKNLAAAYQVMLNERVGIYAKHIGQSTTAPDEPGMEALGVADDKNYVQRALNSVTIKPATDDLLKSAGKWNLVDDYEDSLKLPIAMAFSNHGLSSNEISKLIKEKASLTDFIQSVNTEVSFNARDVVVDNLKKLFPDNEHLDYLFDYVFAKKPKISDVGVGMGEVALSIFTNCVKGKVGDLDSSIGAIEVKSSGGRLASPSHVNYNYAKDLAQFLAQGNIKQKTNRNLHNLKNSVILDVNKVLTDKKLEGNFTNQFVQTVKGLVSKVGTESFEKSYASSIFSQYIASQKELYGKYLNLKFIELPQFQGTRNEIQKQEKIWTADTVKLVREINEQIRRAFNQNIFSDKTVNKVNQRKLDYAMATQQDIKDIATAETPLEALEEFYFTDFGLTAEQKAEALTLIVSSEYRTTANLFKGEIISFFQDHENLFKRGSDVIIKAMVFAMQVAVYAHDHFQYLLLINKYSKQAIGLQATSFTKLASKYLTDSAAAGFAIGIDIDKTRGGSALEFGKKPKDSAATESTENAE